MKRICHGFIDDVEVEHECPVFHVPDVCFYTSFHLTQFAGLPTETGYLCPACDARFVKVAHHIFIDKLLVFFRMFQHVVAWTDNGHIAQQHVDELGKLVNVGLAHKVAELCLAGVV